MLYCVLALAINVFCIAFSYFANFVGRRYALDVLFLCVLLLPLTLSATIVVAVPNGYYVVLANNFEWFTGFILAMVLLLFVEYYLCKRVLEHFGKLFVDVHHVEIFADVFNVLTAIGLSFALFLKDAYISYVFKDTVEALLENIKVSILVACITNWKLAFNSFLRAHRTTGSKKEIHNHKN